MMQMLDDSPLSQMPKRHPRAGERTLRAPAPESLYPRPRRSEDQKGHDASREGFARHDGYSQWFLFWTITGRRASQVPGLPIADCRGKRDKLRNDGLMQQGLEPRGTAHPSVRNQRQWQQRRYELGGRLLTVWLGQELTPLCVPHPLPVWGTSHDAVDQTGSISGAVSLLPCLLWQPSSALVFHRGLVRSSLRRRCNMKHTANGLDFHLS